MGRHGLLIGRPRALATVRASATPAVLCGVGRGPRPCLQSSAGWAGALGVSPMISGLPPPETVPHWELRSQGGEVLGWPPVLLPSCVLGARAPQPCCADPGSGPATEPGRRAWPLHTWSQQSWESCHQILFPLSCKTGILLQGTSVHGEKGAVIS